MLVALGAFVALGALAACGAGTEGDADAADARDVELESLEQALSASCGSTGPVQRAFNARANAFTATATMQAQGCQGDSYMFSIQSYNSGLNPLQNPSIRPATSPATQADCEATVLWFYVWSGTTPLGSDTEQGEWQGSGLGCDLTLSAPASLVSGNSYKFAISARRPANVPISVRLEHAFRP
jgi:hypothetical protein